LEGRRGDLAVAQVRNDSLQGCQADADWEGTQQAVWSLLLETDRLARVFESTVIASPNPMALLKVRFVESGLPRVYLE
jgi:hypothetical protein